MTDGGNPMYGHWTRQRIIEAIQDYEYQYGRLPSACDWNVGMARANGRLDLVERFYDDACWPHANTLRYVFGGWNAAIRAAGFEPRAPGKRGPTSEYARIHLLPLANHGNGPGSMPRTHCKRGHEFTPENTYVFKQGRICKTCQAMRARKNYLRRKSAGDVPVPVLPRRHPA